MRSLFSGVSGLKAHQTGMDVIGNNIANVNTTGFKSSRTTFADTLSQTLTGASAPGDTVGGTNPKQIGLGTGVASIDLLFTDGSVQSTGKNTDLCLSGNGLFVVKNGNQTYYTRDGAFEFDSAGNYVLPSSGLYVQGWMATDGVLSTNGSAGNITIPAGKSMASKSSSVATYANNLNAAALTIKSITGGAVTAAGDSASATATYPVKLTLKDGTTATVTSGTYSVSGTYTQDITTGTVTKSADNTVKLTLSDGTTVDDASLTGGPAYTVGKVYNGGTATITSISTSSEITAMSQDSTKSATASKANPITLTMSDGTTVTQTSGSYTVNNSLPVTTTLTVYDSLGNAHNVPVYFTKTKTDTTGLTGNEWTVSLATDVTAATSTLSEDDGSTTTLNMAPVKLQFDTNGKFVSGNGTSTLTLTNGSGTNQQVTLDLTSLTQYAGKSTVNGSADGNAAGTLSSVSVDSSGIITGTYTNGVKQAEAQVAIAQFTNASGLEKNGNSLYQESNNSGTANVKTASDLGVTITPSALEMSNVDIANEFSNMIVTQRGFQSNSKIITVGDEMLETLINMKR